MTKGKDEGKDEGKGKDETSITKGTTVALSVVASMFGFFAGLFLYVTDLKGDVIVNQERVSYIKERQQTLEKDVKEALIGIRNELRDLNTKIK